MKYFSKTVLILMGISVLGCVYFYTHRPLVGELVDHKTDYSKWYIMDKLPSIDAIVGERSMKFLKDASVPDRFSVEFEYDNIMLPLDDVYAYFLEISTNYGFAPMHSYDLSVCPGRVVLYLVDSSTASTNWACVVDIDFQESGYRIKVDAGLASVSTNN